MASRPGRNGKALDSARGRSDTAAQLRCHLSSAPPSYLLGALENPELSEEEMLLLLQNRAAPAALLNRVGRDRRWAKIYEVRKHLTRNPRTPLSLARSLLSHLYWRDLADTADDLRAPPAVRRQAEEALKVRLAEMTLGERITLARRASRGVIAALRDSPEGRVVRALLGNVRLMEHDAVRIAGNEQVPGEALSLVAEHPTWGIRYAVRLAILGNPRTPVPVALRLIEKLSQQDLQRLARDSRIPKIVRVGADRRMELRSGMTKRGSRG